MINTLEEFVEEFKKIKQRGWIKTHRSGPTGIGKTLEDILGIPENNLGEPDFGKYELKSARVDSGSMLTMFTKSPEPRGANTTLRIKYGYSSSAYDNDEKVLHSTLTAARFVPIHDTGQKLKIICDDTKISIKSETEVEKIYWEKESLRKVFNRKYRNEFVYVKALSKGTGRDEHFSFTRADLVSEFNYDAMIKLLEEGKIYIDLRIGQYPDGRTHDHGTGFRIRECDQELLFRNKERLI